jgi:hypothetical protein
MRRRALRIAAVALVVLLVAAAGLAGLGSRQTYDRADGPAPGWAKPCLERAPRQDRPLLHFCARVRGRVLHVGRSYTNELHLGVVARWRVLVVKLPSDADPPSVGSMATFVGPLVRVRWGFEEVQAFETS